MSGTKSADDPIAFPPVGHEADRPLPHAPRQDGGVPAPGAIHVKVLEKGRHTEHRTRRQPGLGARPLREHLAVHPAAQMQVAEHEVWGDAGQDRHGVFTSHRGDGLMTIMFQQVPD